MLRFWMYCVLGLSGLPGFHASNLKVDVLHLWCEERNIVRNCENATEMNFCVGTLIKNEFWRKNQDLRLVMYDSRQLGSMLLGFFCDFNEPSTSIRPDVPVQAPLEIPPTLVVSGENTITQTPVMVSSTFLNVSAAHDVFVEPSNVLSRKEGITQSSSSAKVKVLKDASYVTSTASVPIVNQTNLQLENRGIRNSSSSVDSEQLNSTDYDLTCWVIALCCLIFFVIIVIAVFVWRHEAIESNVYCYTVDSCTTFTTEDDIATSNV